MTRTPHPAFHRRRGRTADTCGVRTANEVPDRTMFGSDAPYGDPFLARATVERVTGPGTLRDRVLGGTLAELLGL
ncbi:hypothetical protein ABTX85_19640 [Streptomyces sp. NPDC096097]|uniref:hypothetical protein n=1 Tax=Streptomyces sp. NPDC096097 TaxID=3155546 RepID=UPI00332EF2B1